MSAFRPTKQERVESKVNSTLSCFERLFNYTTNRFDNKSDKIPYAICGITFVE